MMKYLTQSRLTAIILDTLEPRTATVTDEALLDAIQLEPFSSVRELANPKEQRRQMIRPDPI
jgi:hypothetical protein